MFDEHWAKNVPQPFNAVHFSQSRLSQEYGLPANNKLTSCPESSDRIGPARRSRSR
jgi:hypothetical protein